ncbi:unnamed protein product [Bursaphelenchus xylophilus]|uniref:(pine wood nematode) hypothetical protein n=1 Tax=Bursaphelenchus xylophilus TaxID=6326 RepID=A0A1I7RJH4_BURXY|nr:unnamed protein product [Bursaphelenchus xylophilus]CAG9128887.1 unnamed protein product [Bursaphelenchus xylophilus]
MLEGLVTWVLNNYVGEYLENLNADQISIALLQGQVELENVPLRKTALRKFDVPLEVRSGIIGKLTLSVPIAHIKSEPWVLKMSDLLILLGPNSDPSSNLDLVEESEQSKKEQMYEELEKLHKQRLLDAASITLQLEEIQNAWWGASLVSAVSNNIQLILNNVHIRYEDDKTMPDKMPFHFGFRIHNISIQTTNSQWKPGFVQPEDGTNTFKKLDVKGFSVFWNCSQEMDVDIDTYEKLKKILAPETSKNNTFILKPFSMTVRMEKNASKFPLKQNPPIPRFTFDLRPERIEIELSKRQLAQIRVLSAEWARFDRARQHRKWRPLTRITGNAKDWWKFAYGRIAEDNRKQRSTASAAFVLKRAKLLNNYCKAYTRKLKAFVADQKAKQAKVKDPNSKVASTSAISPEDSAYMKQIEHDSEFTYNELHLFREIVFRKYLKQIEAEENGLKESDSAETFEVVSPDSEPSRSKSHDVLSRETSVEPSAQMSSSMYDRKASNTSQTPAPQGEQGPGFYGWLASWFTAGEDPNKKPKEEDINQAAFLNMWPQDGNRELPPNLRRVEKRIEEELLDVLSESWDDSTVLRRDNLLAEVVLQLERMIVRFVDDDELTCLGLSRILALDMSTVASRVLLSPREHRTEISLSVMDMSVQRLRVAPQRSPELSRAGSMSDLQEDIEDSLWTGVGVAAMDTEVLFAVGRTKGDDNKTDNTISSSEKKCEPLLQFFYRRLAPRLNVFHEISASFLPIAVVYDEDALDGLANLFDTDSAFFSQDQTKEKEQEAALKEFEPDNQIFFTVNIPEVQLELRSKRKSPTDEILLCQNSQPFASATLTSVCMGLVRTEKFLSRMKLGFDQFELKDLFEKTHWPLLKTVPPNGTITGTKTRSLSLPTLTDSQTSRNDSDLFSSSLPTELKGISAISADLKTARSPNSAVPPSLKRPGLALDNDFGHWDQSCVLLNLIFVDEKHPKFEETYQKQHCTVKANFSEVEVGMNARTWTMLLNFFGALGQKPGHGDQFVHELPTTSEAASDPILEALLYGKKMSEDEIAKTRHISKDA